ncbi:class I SAM-dependent DNA methyltransferase [Psychrobacillus psychrodurans]|uniref:class I SAM-dependent DNA methyltransferase n=1 Tax=Psychrobacillus psychrodurans TaxID=126157 RepID=UPI0008F2D819|nr:class I SAM-dependent methyltransferase [Psychrobacillus psychrodurans]MCZ8541524.1 methyltransferase domain-containing protein [Psychrobacillus psychrodurans]SFN03747.1 Methyltransferase domain-containing protein [Psychrobacillus psychrodurans]
MSTYEQFAYIYDSLMSDIPYNKYAEWVRQYAPVTTSKKLVDIGCGTGVLSNHFAKAGYEVTGVDLSDSMLTVAQNRSFENGTNISFICQSMAELEGVNEVDVAVIAIDSINYLETLEEVEQTFKRLFEALNPSGQLFFDVHSLYKMEVIYPNGPFTYEDEEVAYIWHTEPGEENHSIYHDITFFVRDESGYYERFEESHYQRTYSVETFKTLLETVGFSSVNVRDDIFGKPIGEVDRWFIHAVK